ncbi:hypothetical protein OS493_024234 [Desmophyllum pertusum]|uniref:Uncharacterized protein n=1 Tax=Desmophyllum pertusum TaxID=174260 RepID=A0A9X0CXS5_9CNID|nr:hypothetical protein OS493_024234 [Desmophyllum pertusum]
MYLKPSSDLQRGSTGAVKSRPFGNNSVGTSTRIIAKQGHSSTGGRILPSGPGPLPNRSMLDNKSGTVKFVTASSSTRDHAKGSSFNHVINHQNRMSWTLLRHGGKFQPTLDMGVPLEGIDLSRAIIDMVI